jgi:hypothetical protein
MPDNGTPATGPLIVQHVIQIESTMNDLRQLFEAHAGAASRPRKMRPHCSSCHTYQI